MLFTRRGSPSPPPRPDGKEEARILACGASYAFQRRLGLGLPKAYLQTAQRELPAERISDVELHFGRTLAPQGFAWAVPVRRPDGLHVRVGVMAADDAVGCYRRMLPRVWSSNSSLPSNSISQATSRPRGRCSKNCARHFSRATCVRERC